jgi:hypothetical protein
VVVHSQKATQDEGADQGTTLLTTSLAGGQGGELLRKVVEMALGGNVPMMEFLLDRILPKERPIQLELPDLDFADDSVDAMAKIVDAVSSGRITPREAADVAQLVSAFTRAIDITEAQAQIDFLKSKLDGVNLTGWRIESERERKKEQKEREKKEKRKSNESFYASKDPPPSGRCRAVPCSA